jgi:hypothetical protein
MKRKMSHRGGGGPKKCHVLFEWPQMSICEFILIRSQNDKIRNLMFFALSSTTSNEVVYEQLEE